MKFGGITSFYHWKTFVLLKTLLEVLSLVTGVLYFITRVIGTINWQSSKNDNFCTHGM